MELSCTDERAAVEGIAVPQQVPWSLPSVNHMSAWSETPTNQTLMPYPMDVLHCNTVISISDCGLAYEFANFCVVFAIWFYAIIWKLNSWTNPEHMTENNDVLRVLSQLFPYSCPVALTNCGVLLYPKKPVEALWAFPPCLFCVSDTDVNNIAVMKRSQLSLWNDSMEGRLRELITPAALCSF